jgi:DNA-binding Xre family transcriptional regulator
MENGMTIKSRLKWIMQKKGLTMAKLAQDSGVAIETIRRARGDELRLCRMETLEAIAKALNVRIRDLFEE